MNQISFNDQPSNWDPSRIKRITSKEEMNTHLKESNNVYTRFILEKLAEKDSNKPEVSKIDETQPKVVEDGNRRILFEKHHIIPRSLGSPDASWNLIVLTVEDHFTAHKLRYEAYNQFNPDGLFLNFRTNVTSEQREKAFRAGHLTQKEFKLGFYDSEAQSKRGKKGGAKQTQNKIEKYREKLSPQVEEALTRSYMLWVHKYKTTKEVTVAIFIPNQLYLVDELYFNLDQRVPFANRNKTNHTSGLAKVIKGVRQSYCGWSLRLFNNETALYEYMESDKLL